MQTLRSIFNHSDLCVSTPYIHALAPRIVEYLYTDSTKKVTTESELMVTLEAITTVESLISLAEPQNRKFRLVIFFWRWKSYLSTVFIFL